MARELTKREGPKRRKKPFPSQETELSLAPMRLKTTESPMAMGRLQSFLHPPARISCTRLSCTGSPHLSSPSAPLLLSAASPHLSSRARLRPHRPPLCSRARRAGRWIRCAAPISPVCFTAPSRRRLRGQGRWRGLLRPRCRHLHRPPRPVSNIMANSTCTSDLLPELREKVLVGTAVERKLDGLCQRSLEGLVAFLSPSSPTSAR